MLCCKFTKNISFSQINAIKFIYFMAILQHHFKSFCFIRLQKYEPTVDEVNK